MCFSCLPKEHERSERTSESLGHVLSLAMSLMKLTPNPSGSIWLPTAGPWSSKRLVHSSCLVHPTCLVRPTAPARPISPAHPIWKTSGAKLLERHDVGY